MFKIIKKIITPTSTLEDILIKSVEENLQIIFKKEINKETLYMPLQNNDIDYVRKELGAFLDKKFYFYVIDDCIFAEQH